MKKTFNVDPELLKKAREACGAHTDTETIRQGLEALVRSAAYRAIREYIGSEPDALKTEVPRRREEPRRQKPARKRRVA
jgi:Bacterial antitoxin of type II TA system, VapB